jgi:alkaline phosphatase D
MAVMRRRDFLGLAAVAGPALIAADRPQLKWGVQIGDVTGGRALLWAKSDRAAELAVEWDTSERFTDPRRVTGGIARPETDFTTRLDLTRLPAGQRIFYRAMLEEKGEPVNGSFRTPPASRSNVRFLWSGDTAGQGYGINPDWGGMKIYKTMREADPDFFIHSGDTIYADGPIPAEVKLRDGSVWRNVTTEAKSKVAETLDDFRGNYLYNLLDEHVRAFNAAVPQVWQWDDHEVMNNWSPGKDLTADARYREKSIATIASRARRAFLEYAPMRVSKERIYRTVPYGPLLDVFVIDLRSYRGRNTHNRQTEASADTVYLGRPQIEWLKQGLAKSKALWKVIACDMPIGLLVPDGKDTEGRQVFEASANGDGPPLGRELEIADLLRTMKRKGVKNVVWLTADVHYTAAHKYYPSKAQFTDFDPFWEFISGPLNSGTFGPGTLENTFGPEVVYYKAPPKGQSAMAPSAGLQFFGEVEIEGRTGEMTVRLRDLTGAALFTQRIAPERQR